jgi:hypothetical protein
MSYERVFHQLPELTVCITLFGAEIHYFLPHRGYKILSLQTQYLTQFVFYIRSGALLSSNEMCEGSVRLDILS